MREKNLRSDIRLLRNAVLYRGGVLRESPSAVQLIGGGAGAGAAGVVVGRAGRCGEEVGEGKAHLGGTPGGVASMASPLEK
ncbi:hypothetical protein HDU67_003359, partial [Dinochytrium kinnereticum]